jgi:amidohydrolase
MTQQSLASLISTARPDLAPYEKLRIHLHSHPELSQQESATAAIIAAHPALKPYTIHQKIGGHGLAAVLHNGPGKTVLLRADMDALPVLEQTGLSYASKVEMRDTDGKVKPVMHACGHDIHITCLLAAAELLASSVMRSVWTGTLVLVFQPAEERGCGAQSMVDDGLYHQVPVPDVVLGQHVMPLRAGKVGSRSGVMMAASDSLAVTLFGRGGHASMPNRTIDPVVMAAATVMRLQGIVSREVDPSRMAVVTVGALQAGDAENVISDRAELKVNIRTVDRATREQVIKSVKRIVKAEADASGAEKEPEVRATSSFPVTINEENVTARLQSAFVDYFGADFDKNLPVINGSEDFSILGTAVGRPCSFWMIGGTCPEKWDEAEREGKLQEKIPVNHSPFFAPVMQPTLRVGTDALALAAMTFLRDEEAEF